MVAVVGPSGSGKSFLAQHVAAGQGDDGALVVWIQASDYERRFSFLLPRAMAPYSADRWDRLVGAAEEFGIAVTVVLDGLNECPPDERSKLLDQLKAFILRHPASVLITSTSVDDLGHALEAAVLRVNEPDERGRLEILTSHGAKHPERTSPQFRIPFDLSIAAQCERELHEDATVAELHDNYIRRFAPTEELRAGLRSLASHLHSTLRTSLPRLKANSILCSPKLGLTSGQVDEVLHNCRLLADDPQRVRFRHELVGQFLAAEDIVRSATSDRTLGMQLGAPANTALTETALQIEPDRHRVWEALRQLSNPTQVLSALDGNYGAAVADMANQEIRNVLHSAIASTAAATARFESGSWRLGGRWVSEREWTEWERTLLITAGLGLTKGLFVDEVCALVDRTDEICLAQVHRLAADGDRTPISRVVWATYGHQVSASDIHALAASYVTTAFAMCGRSARSDSSARSCQLARRLADAPNARSWGRFYLALLSVDPDDVPDQALFTSLLPRAWSAGGYHLQLKALNTARIFWGSGEPHRSKILGFVSGLDPGHWGLSGSLIEVLVSFGEVESSITVDDLHAHIRTVISHPDDLDHCQMASGIVSNQFEEEAIVGPYFEAVEELTRHEKVRLYTMAVRVPDPFSSFNLCFALERLTELVPTGIPSLDDTAKSVFANYLGSPPEDNVMQEYAVRAVSLPYEDGPSSSPPYRERPPTKPPKIETGGSSPTFFSATNAMMWK